jgi:hypothetical protein
MEVYNYSRWIDSSDTYELKQKVTAAIFESGLGMIGQQDSDTFGIWISQGAHTALHTINEKTYVEMTSFDESVLLKFKSIIENL